MWRTLQRLGGLLAIVTAIIVWSVSGHAATFNVNSTFDGTDNNIGDGVCSDGQGNCTLRAAIQEANFTVAADDIVISVASVSLFFPGDDDIAAVGDLDITADLTISPSGATAVDVSSAQAQLPIRVFHVHSGVTATFNLLNITGSHASEGAGVLNEGTLTLNTITLANNIALEFSDASLVVRGGAISNLSGAMLTVTDGIFSENMAANNTGTSGSGASLGGAIYNEGTATLTRVIFTENEATPTDQAGEGGAIFNATGGMLTINDSDVGESGNGNSSNDAGGILNRGTAIITNTDVIGNDGGSGFGGGVWNVGPSASYTHNGGSISENNLFGGDGMGLANGNDSTMTLNDVTCNANIDFASSFGGYGGCISNNGGTVTVNRSTITNNFAEANAGGLYSEDGTVLIDETTISGNNTAGSGGGIFHEEDDGGGTVTVLHSLVANNSSGGMGGGIMNVGGSDAELFLRNVTVSGNRSGRAPGSGVANDSGTVEINNSTITLNGFDLSGGGESSEAAGLYNRPITFPGTVTVSNSIVAGNGVVVSAPSVDCGGIAFISLDYNLIGDGTGCTGFTGTNDLVGTAGSPIDAMLDVLQGNGGLTDTHALLAGSPAIDTANPATPGTGSPACEGDDQRTFNRLDGLCDRGAFEVGAAAPICGDGFLDTGEECDDGNTTAGDGCSDICEFEICGDGQVDAGEECDDGNIADDDGCSSQCLNEVCGDGTVQTGEECDDGNLTPGDGCDGNCLMEATGGDTAGGDTAGGDSAGSDTAGGGDDGSATAGDDGAGTNPANAAGNFARGSGACKNSLLDQRANPSVFGLMLLGLSVLISFRLKRVT